MPEPIPLRRRRWRPALSHVSREQWKRDLRRTIAVTTIVTIGFGIVLLLTVNNFDADEWRELATVVSLLGPTVLGLLRLFVKES